MFFLTKLDLDRLSGYGGDMAYKFNILVLNGPNLNMLGTREVDQYNTLTLNTIINYLNTEAASLNVNIEHFQSNAEYALIERIHKAKDNIDYIIINPAAFAHTSIAIRDALLAVSIPFIEIHISNIYAREPFRYNSYLSDIAAGLICGLGADGYSYALQIAVKRLSQSN